MIPFNPDSFKYNDVRRDYERLVQIHGADANDITGGFVADEKFFTLLRKPTKTHARDMYWDLITHTATSGFEDGTGGSKPFTYDEEVCEIYEKYDLLVECERMFG